MNLECEKDAAGGALYTALGPGGPIGYVAVDSTIAGRSCGGLRMMPDVTADEVRGLSRAMTLKYGFLGLPQGGAKAGVIGDPEAPEDERLARLEGFGSAIAPLLKNRTYVPGADMGTDCAGIAHMLCSVGVRVGRRDLRDNSSGYYTAVSAMAAVTVAARYAELDLAGCTAAVEGVGKVGSSLVGLLADAGVRVVGVSTSRGALYNPRGLDVARLVRLSRECGSRMVDVYGAAESIDATSLVLAEADIVCPCARHASITAANASRVRARIICPGANDPISPDAERLLWERGVTILPDFLCNSGGVLGGTMEFASMGRAVIESHIRAFIDAEARAALDAAGKSGSSPRAVAEAASRERFARVKEAAEHPTLSTRAMRLGLSLYHRGFVPPWLVRAMAGRYFDGLLRRTS